MFPLRHAIVHDSPFDG